jgi:hypothetical protein
MASACSVCVVSAAVDVADEDAVSVAAVVLQLVAMVRMSAITHPKANNFFDFVIAVASFYYIVNMQRDRLLNKK